MSTASGPGPEGRPTGKDPEVRDEEEALETAADPTPAAEAADRAQPGGDRLVEQAGGFEIVTEDDDAA